MNVEIYIKRYFWIFWLAVIAAGAYFLARTTNQLIEKKYLIKKTVSRPRQPRAFLPSSAAARHLKDIDNVMAHNVFCSGCAKWVKPSDKPPVDAPPPVVVSDPNNPTKSTLPLALLATQMSTTKASYHRAIIRDVGNSKTATYMVEDELPGGPIVTAILDKRVVFKNGATYEYIDLEGYIGPAPTVAVAPTTYVEPPSTDPPPAEGSLEADLDKGIKRSSETEYQIDRGLLDKLLTDTSALARSARIVPSVKDNKPNGFKLYAIRPGSVYAKIGLMNGDTIQAINGYDMSTPAMALEVYTKLRTAPNLSVSILRRGETKAMNYTIK
jgi:general secretion pathway protein C